MRLSKHIHLIAGIRSLILRTKRKMSSSTEIPPSANEISDSRSQIAKVTTLDEFLEKTRRLLKLEREAEEEQNRLLIETRNLDELCHAGVALKKMHLLDRRTGLGGRRLLKFGYNDTSSDEDSGTPLPNHKLSPGDIVNLCPSNDHRNPLASGVVSKVVEHSITVAFDEESSRNEDGSSNLSISNMVNRTFTLVQSVNDVTFRRLTATLDALGGYKKYPGWILVEYLFSARQIPAIDRPGDRISTDQSKIYFNANLNQPQRRAVDFCLNDHHPISIVHGPPGTGKTTVVVEIIRQLVKNRKKVLACAPSNVAVDNLLEKLVSIDSDQPIDSINVVRLGHPARTHSSVQKYSLDLILKQREYSAILDDIRQDIESLEDERDRRYAYRQRKELRQELYEREKSAVKSILQNANVVCGTLTSITRDGPLGNLLKDDDQLSIFSSGRKFDVAVIDECGQATELACWSALMAVSGEKCILAGDHRQLPPTIISEEAAKNGFDRSLMARVSEELGDAVVNMLTVQYRMNSEIMNWPSEHVYGGRLEADSGVASRLLRDIPQVESTEESESPLWFIDTADCDMPEIVTVDDESKANVGEVRLVFLHVNRLIRSGVSQQSIAIISPYNLQVQLLRTYIGGVYPNLSIRSVDGFQGQERDAVILSLVRSNPKGEVGFLAERRRMNVAVTRAKRHLAIIGDARTVRSDQFLRSLVEYMGKTGVVKSALEYEDDYHLIPFSIDVEGLALSKPSAPVTATASATSNTSASKNAKPVKVQPKAMKKSVDKSKKQQDMTYEKAKTEGEKRTGNVEAVSDWRKELKEQLEAFVLNEDAGRLEFSVELLAHQRAYAHEIADEMGFNHFSENIGSQRRIVVQKKEAAATASSPTIGSISDTDQATIDLPLQESQKQPSQAAKPKKSPKKKENEPKIAQAAQATTADDDDEKLMEKFAHEERHCKFSDCRQPTALLGEKCRYCIQIFCLKHAMPEVHGCGEAAKRHARMEFERTMSAPTKMTKSNSVNVEKRERLQAKLDEKLKTMKGQRQQKKPK